MKKIFTLVALLMTMATSTTLLQSCGDDAEDEVVVATPVAKEVAGTYTGDGTMTVMGQKSEYPGVSYVLEVKDDNTVNLIIPATGEGAMSFPDLKVEGIAVTKLSDGTYKLADTEYTGSVVVNEATKKYSVTLEGSTISGTTLKLNYSLQYGSMPMAMVTTFEGTKAN